MTQRDEQILAAELVQAVLTRLSAATPRLLMERITVLERENAALRAAMAMTNQEEPESNPLRAAVVAYLAAHDFYVQAIRSGASSDVDGDTLWRKRQALRRLVEGGEA